MEKTITIKKELALTCNLDAPRELLFRAWTDPKLLVKWWGPHGFTNPVCELDVRPRGAIRIDMRRSDGIIFPMKGVFHEIVEPRHLVFTSTAFHDEKGNARLEVLNTITFATYNGKTRLTVHVVVMKATHEAEPALAGMEEGWSQSLERLTKCVSAT